MVTGSILFVTFQGWSRSSRYPSESERYMDETLSGERETQTERRRKRGHSSTVWYVVLMARPRRFLVKNQTTPKKPKTTKQQQQPQTKKTRIGVGGARPSWRAVHH